MSAKYKIITGTAEEVEQKVNNLIDKEIGWLVSGDLVAIGDQVAQVMLLYEGAQGLQAKR